MMQRIGIDLDGNFHGHYRAIRPVSIHLQEDWIHCIIFCGRVYQITFLLYLELLIITLIISSPFASFP